MYGTGYLLVSQAHGIGLACFGIMTAHAGGAMVWVFSTTLLQMITEDNFRGRVFAAEYGFLTFAMAVATFLVGLHSITACTLREWPCTPVSRRWCRSHCGRWRKPDGATKNRQPRLT